MAKLLFAIETLQVIFMIICFIKYKVHKSINAILFWFALNAFYTPNIYYVVMNGTAYKVFNEQSYLIYLLVGIIYLFGFHIIVKITENRKINVIRIKLVIPKIAKVILSISVIAGCLTYIVKYSYGFPLLNFLRTRIMIDYRPDTSGLIPHFFIVGTIIMMVIPMILFYYDEVKCWSKKKFALMTIVMIPLLFISGNQGLFVYFIIFLWMYKLNYKISPSIIGLGIFSLLMYGIIKGSPGLSGSNNALRRFFVTQGAGIIARIQLILDGFDFSGKSIADVTFVYIYGYTGGSHPTFFAGDLFVQCGIIFGLILSVIITFFLVLIGRTIDYNSSRYKKWTYYMVIYLFGMAGIHIQLVIRSTILLIFYNLLKNAYGTSIDNQESEMFYNHKSKHLKFVIRR